MTTVVPFVPSTSAAFSFQATLDGNPYNAVVTWSLFGQRYYLNLTASDGTPILTTALIGSPSPLQLIALSWANGLAIAQTGTVVTVNVPGSGPTLITAGTAGTGAIIDTDVELEITAGLAHGLRIGSVVPLVISGVTPDAYNGEVDALVTSPVAFTYPIASNPGIATVFGRASYDFNLIGGVTNENGEFFTSTLVFRQQAQQFEISP